MLAVEKLFGETGENVTCEIVQAQALRIQPGLKGRAWKAHVLDEWPLVDVGRLLQRREVVLRRQLFEAPDIDADRCRVQRQLFPAVGRQDVTRLVERFAQVDKTLSEALSRLLLAAVGPEEI